MRKFIIPYSEEAIIWHLRNNVHPLMSDLAIANVTNAVKEFNEGRLTLQSAIQADGEITTVGEMFENLKIDWEER